LKQFFYLEKKFSLCWIRHGWNCRSSLLSLLYKQHPKNPSPLPPFLPPLLPAIFAVRLCRIYIYTCVCVCVCTYIMSRCWTSRNTTSKEAKSLFRLPHPRTIVLSGTLSHNRLRRKNVHYKQPFLRTHTRACIQGEKHMHANVTHTHTHTHTHAYMVKNTLLHWNQKVFLTTACMHVHCTCMLNVHAC
jgi:hypothetical protein